ncbi:adenosylcobyric acid synthase [Anaerolineales bacterium]|nr:adenosylcobyric acid synthase [Anaerolineales bacterium]
MTAKVLMVQGTSSSAGKSLLVTALCRIYARRGIKVSPFKAQNMSNNAAVCADGSEIGRAQALQAAAAGLAPTVDMNPVLIKPEADSRSQVILMGRPWNTLEAKNYYEKKAILWEHVTTSLDRLRDAYDLVIIEGAGSAAEINLRRGDIVNMAVARYANAPVLLIGDIDRGGIFAQLLGTLWLLDPDERALVRGLVVNKFRGDLALFSDGVQILEEKGDVPVLGVLPYLRNLNLPDEDAVSVENALHSPFDFAQGESNQIDIAVLALPRISNFDDFDPLKAETGVTVRYVSSANEFGSPSAVIIPGTKSTIADLDWLRQTGLAEAVAKFVKVGGSVVGICGGYQMLGEAIADPHHVEAKVEQTLGLDLLPVRTEFLKEKATFQAQARINCQRGWMSQLDESTVGGYEIHMGETPSQTAWLEIVSRNGQPVKVADGSISADGKIWGCYLHGIFANDEFRHAWLESLGWQRRSGASQSEIFNQSLETLADAVEGALNMDLLEKIIWDK